VNFLKTLKVDIIADPKPKNSWMYKNVFMITPNEKEWEEIKKTETFFQHVLITKGSKGMELQNFDKNWIIETEPVSIYNVSGAGDTVLAVMGVCKILNISPLKSAKIANECARYVVTEPGTTAVPRNVFDKALSKFE
jgi:bifunctional ADP-heptose synthase (sugar kinase/adenylyltransferase)